MYTVTEFHPTKSGPMIARHNGGHIPAAVKQNINIAGIDYIIKFIDWSIDGADLPTSQQCIRQNIYLEKTK